MPKDSNSNHPEPQVLGLTGALGVVGSVTAGALLGLQFGLLIAAVYFVSAFALALSYRWLLGIGNQLQAQVSRLRPSQLRSVLYVGLVCVVGLGVGLGISLSLSPSPAPPKTSTSNQQDAVLRASGTERHVGGITVELNAGNVTAGDTKYVPIIQAGYDQVIKAELYYFVNRSSAGSDVSVSIRQGQRIGDLVPIASTIRVDGHTIRVVASVELDRWDASLSYISGSPTWRSVDQNAQGVESIHDSPLSDAISDGSSQSLGAIAAGNYGYVTVLFRAVVPSMTLTANGAGAGSDIPFTVNPGQTFNLTASIANGGDVPITSTVLKCDFARGTSVVGSPEVLLDGGTVDSSAANYEAVPIGTVQVGQTAKVVSPMRVSAASVPGTVLLFKLSVSAGSANAETIWTSGSVVSPGTS